MAEIKPFKGIRYNQKKVRIDDVVTQPYDKISRKMQSSYYEKSPYNIVRIILNKEDDPYTSASRYFKEWIDNGVLIQDAEPSIYPYFQEYHTDGIDTGEATCIRKGFVALLKLEDFCTRVVLPHERTFSGPKEDRLTLLRATHANFGQIFMLYSDPELKIQSLIDDEVADTPPLINVSEVYESGVSHKLWRIWDNKVMNEIQELMKPKSLLIADGHHRYETALNYSKEKSDAAYRMVTFVGMEDPGLMILPTHRAIYGVDTGNFMNKVTQYFELEPCPNKEAMLEKLHDSSHTFGVYNGEYRLLKLRDESLIEKFGEKGRTYDYKALDITVLHRIMFEIVLNIPKEKLLKKECIDYLRDVDKGIQGVDNHKYNLFFILNPTHIDQVQKISAQREVMPHKSTDFYPKLITGLVINKF